MKVKQYVWKSALPVLSAALILGQSISADELNPGDVGYWASQEMDKINGTDFVSIAESDTMELLIKQKTGTLRWMNKKTGAYKDTNLSADENLEKITEAEKSDLSVSYFNGKNSELYQTYATWDSFSMCADLGQLSYQLIDNGVRVIYTMGDDSMSYKNFPVDISEERMQEFVLQYLDDKQIATLKSTYYSQLSTGAWHRKSNKNQLLGKLQVKELYNMFYEVGKYTEEELYADLEAAEVDQDEYPSSLSIVVPVEYYLDGDELVVNVDTAAIETDDAKNPIMSMSLLPYFLTSSTAGEPEEGYMFVPDGSGALINLDSTKTKEYHYAASFYGGDKLVNATTYNSVNSKLQMPVFGMKDSVSTIMGVIESGAEIASLDAYIANTDNSEPFCKIKLSFGIRPQQRFASDSSSAYSVTKASSDAYDENITLRYYWLDEDATYVEMAQTYAQYLTEKGELTAEEHEEEAPFYVEVLGSTDKTMYRLGIPYEGKETLTSFDEAAEILDDLTEAGIQNVKMIYSGMVNGGMNQRALTNGVTYASGLGGKSGFQSLLSKAESVGAEVFPNLQLQTAYTKKNLGDNKVAWNIVNNRGQIYEFDPVTMQVAEDTDYDLYVVNPNYMPTYLETVEKSLSKLGIGSVASSDFLTFIGTNYKGEQVSPSTGEAIYMDGVKALTSNVKLMLANPISDAYAYSNYLTDIPTTDSGMRVLDASVPFMQLVLDGCKTYSCESLNLETTDIRQEFMHAIETKSALKFTFTYRDSTLLSKTEQDDLFAVDYNYWKSEIGGIYEEYKAFYDKVKDATIEKHELFERNDNLRVVTYSNGVKVYFNYSDLDETIDGVAVPAFDYKVVA